MAGRRRRAPARLVTAAVAVAAVVPLHGALTLDVSHRARAIHPGEVVVLEVRASDPIATLHAIAFGKPVRFFRAPGDIWTALVGVDVAVEPGPYGVAVEAAAPDGARARATYRLVVEPKAFPTRRLTVDPSFVTPPDEVVARIQREARQLAELFAGATEDRLWSGRFIRPVPGAATSSFGRRSVFNGQPRSPHSGTDFRAAAGTPIQAPQHGVIVLAADLYFSGNVVIIDHGWGLYSYFAHLSSIDVGEGDRVDQGAVVGKVGATGRVTGPHLHWTVRLNDARVDPLSLMALFPAE